MIRLIIQASRTGWPSGPTTRPFTVAPRRSTTLTSWLPMPGFRSSEGVAVRVDPDAARLALPDHPTADGLEHVIVAGAQDEEVTRAGLGPELKRAIGCGIDDHAPVLPFAGRIRVKTNSTSPRDGLAGALLGDLAVDRYAPRQGEVEGLLERALGPLDAPLADEVGLSLRGIGRDVVGAVRRPGIHAGPPLGVGLGFVEMATLPRLAITLSGA